MVACFHGEAGDSLGKTWIAWQKRFAYVESLAARATIVAPSPGEPTIAVPAGSASLLVLLNQTHISICLPRALSDSGTALRRFLAAIGAKS
jgi:hypothetical protein